MKRFSHISRSGAQSCLRTNPLLQQTIASLSPILFPTAIGVVCNQSMDLFELLEGFIITFLSYGVFHAIKQFPQNTANQSVRVFKKLVLSLSLIYCRIDFDAIHLRAHVLHILEVIQIQSSYENVFHFPLNSDGVDAVKGQVFDYLHTNKDIFICRQL